MQRNGVKGGDTSMENFITVLELLAEDIPGLTLACVAVRLGIGQSKAQRILSTMQDRGIVECDGKGEYRLGLVTVGLARRLLDRVSIIGHARPVLEDLAKKHGEAVYLTVLRDDEVIFLDGAEEEGQERAPSLVGKRFPALSTTPGKVIRSLQSRDLLEKLVRGRRRSNQGVELEELCAELDRIRSTGVAVDVGNLTEGVSSVAAAVRDYAGKVVCALTVLGPTFRMLAGRIEEEIAPSLMAGAELLSAKLGRVKTLQT